MNKKYNDFRDMSVKDTNDTKPEIKHAFTKSHEVAPTKLSVKYWLPKQNLIQLHLLLKI